MIRAKQISILPKIQKYAYGYFQNFRKENQFEIRNYPFTIFNSTDCFLVQIESFELDFCGELFLR